MAVDTRNKRASVIQFALPFRVAMPDPDGSLASQDDRQHMAYSYLGISAGAVSSFLSRLMLLGAG